MPLEDNLSPVLNLKVVCFERSCILCFFCGCYCFGCHSTSVVNTYHCAIAIIVIVVNVAVVIVVGNFVGDVGGNVIGNGFDNVVGSVFAVVVNVVHNVFFSGVDSLSKGRQEANFAPGEFKIIMIIMFYQLCDSF